jgi:hypothetical protein
MCQPQATAAFLIALFCFGCAPAPTVSNPSQTGSKNEDSEVSAPAPTNVLPLKISSVLQVSAVQIDEAHGNGRGLKTWSLIAANNTAYIEVDGTDSGDLLRISISICQQTPGNGIEADLATIRTITGQMVPNDPWFSSDWFSDAGTDHELPTDVEHNQFWLSLDVVKGRTVLTITPAADHKVAANAKLLAHELAESQGKNEGEQSGEPELPITPD